VNSAVCTLFQILSPSQWLPVIGFLAVVELFGNGGGGCDFVLLYETVILPTQHKLLTSM
jgi:hypothetical protein